MTNKHFIAGIEGIDQDTTDSLFDVDQWAVYDWSMLLTNNDFLAGMVEAGKQAGVDARDAFFALGGYSLKETKTPTSQQWASMLNSAPWKKAIAQAKDPQSKASLLTYMLRKMGRRALDQQEEQEGTPEELEEQEDPQTLTLEDLLGLVTEEELDPNVPTEEELEDASTFMLLVNFLNDVHGEKVELEDVLELAQTIDMQALKDLFGFAARVVRGAARKSHGVRGEMVGFKSGSWSDKVVIQDMIGVAQGNLETLVKLAEGQLAEKDYMSEEPQGKGPAVLLRDETGSMFDHSGDSPHHKALSLEIAMANSFIEDGRDLVTIVWGGRKNGTSETRQFTWGEGDGLEHLQTPCFRSSYTYLYDALRQALKVAREYVPGSDIIILTDGHLQDSEKLMNDAALARELNEFWSEKGRIWAILVGGLDKSAWYNKLPIVDGIIQVDDIRSGDALAKMLAAIADRSPKGTSKVSLV